MLKAIISGKAGRLPDGLRPGDTWKHAFRNSEDLLTATVFERLAYLDGPHLWDIIRTTFKPLLLPPRRVAELTDVAFWPTWTDSDGSIGQDVEPDVVLSFSVGDPPLSIVLIVECKLGSGQYPDQWAREWKAFEGQHTTGERPDEVWLLALGGLPYGPAQTVTQFSNQIQSKYGYDVRALAADWSDLSRALDERAPGDTTSDRIVSDIRAALELNGYRVVRPMADLVKFAHRYRVSPLSAASIRKGPLDRFSPAKPKPQDDLTRFKAMVEVIASTEKYRPHPGSSLILRR